MNKKQGAILILAAFGIISIVMSQTALYSHKTPEQYSEKNDIHITSQSGQSLSNSDANTFTSVQNIYNATNGSFYFYTQALGTNSEQTPRTFTQASLKSTTAKIEVTGPIARTKLTQVFANSSNEDVSGVYVFPLPHDAAVDGLVMTIGDRTIRGEIKEKQLAKKAFDKAKAQGKRASLLSQLRPNMFTNHIANIPAHSTISVTIEYQQFIEQNNQQYSLRVPLSITPRYTPVNSEQDTHKGLVQSLKNIKEHKNSVGSVLSQTDIQVSLNTGLPLSAISSEHHPITTHNPYSTEYQIQLDTRTPVNKDFVLNWQVKPSHNIQASHFTYNDDDYQYGLISIVPPEFEKINVDRNIVFVLDVSGSMMGEPLNQAKMAIAKAISELDETDYFNLLTFSSNTYSLWHKSEQASQAFKDEALQLLFEVEADGGTEMKEAFDTVFSQATVNDALNQIVFVTDGSVSNESELMQSIYTGLGDYRLFTVGIGSAPNAYFMAEAASVGLGTYTFIGDTSQVEHKMQALLKKLKRPALTNIKLNMKDGNKAFGFEIFPSVLPDIYADEPLIITYRRKLAISLPHLNNTVPFTVQGEHMSLLANGQHKKRIWKNSLPNIESANERGINKYWARMKIHSLNQQLHMRQPFSEGYSAFKENIKAGIIKTALKHNLVSEHTSLVAIEQIDESSKEYAEKLSAKAKNAQQLKTMALQRLPQTSTSSGLLAFIGSFLLTMGIFMMRKTRAAL
ncbi:marine proteobacterial sortase target protein [Glaciecola sp. 2405UD65-10]|uniref:marine proteobacterial sortase target protein n=1 Tax=Glaciecola sp. 2405UD65-10 TaxID=3397244 RepID=UPI003B5B2C8A